MNTLEHCYLEYNGIKYYDYTLYHDSNWFHPAPQNITVCENILKKLNTLDGLVDSTIYPPVNSTVHMVQPCLYNMETIRKAYTIKRAFDSADYNVVSPISTNRNVWRYISLKGILIIPMSRAIVAHQRSYGYSKRAPSAAELSIEANTVVPNYDPSGQIYISGIIDFTSLPLSEVFLNILYGICKKPCVPICNLQLNTGDNLTVDCLRLVYEVGKKRYSDQDAEKNLLLQLSAMNNYNWRLFPGTIELLKSMLTKDRYSVFSDVVRHKSRLSKDLQQLIAFGGEYASDDDVALSQEFINSLMNVGELKYVYPSVLFSKLNDYNISIELFEKVYSSVTRIVPKKYAKD